MRDKDKKLQELIGKADYLRVEIKRVKDVLNGTFKHGGKYSAIAHVTRTYRTELKKIYADLITDMYEDYGYDYTREVVANGNN